MTTLGGVQGQFFDVPVANALIPKEGPRAVSVVAPFTVSATTFLIDFQQTQTLQKMSVIQTLFVDNFKNPQPLTILCSGTNELITFPAFAQGYIPVLAVAPSTNFNIATTGAVSVALIFLNVPINPIIWYNNSSGGSATNTIDASDALVAGGVAAAYSSLQGMIYNGANPTPTSGQQLPLQSDLRGHLKVAPYRVSTMQTTQASIGAVSATDLLPASNLRIGASIKNIGAVNFAIGSTSALTYATGFPLAPGESYNIDNPDYVGDIWAIAQSGTATGATIQLVIT